MSADEVTLDLVPEPFQNSGAEAGYPQAAHQYSAQRESGRSQFRWRPPAWRVAFASRKLPCRV